MAEPWFVVCAALAACVLLVVALVIHRARERDDKPIVVRPPPRPIAPGTFSTPRPATPRPATPRPATIKPLARRRAPAGTIIPVAPESGLTIRTKPAAPSIELDESFTPRPKTPLPMFAVSRPIASSIPPPLARAQSPTTLAKAALSAQELATSSLEDIAAKLAVRAINFAVTHATLTMDGIEAKREDGFFGLVPWDAIVDIVARRLPAGDPFDGATFVDIVSTAGATLRILPSTRVDGGPFREESEERARALVKLVAARCRDARLDPATRLFADAGGSAVQLPTTKLLAAHDARFA